MTDADKAMNPQHFGSNPADIRIKLNPEILIRIPDHFRLTFQPSWSMYSLSALISLYYYYYYYYFIPSVSRIMRDFGKKLIK